MATWSEIVNEAQNLKDQLEARGEFDLASEAQLIVDAGLEHLGNED